MPATIASKNNGNGPYAQTGKEGCEGLWPSPVNVIRRYFIRLGDPRRKIIVLGVIILCWDREGRYPIKEKEKKREGKEKLKEKEGERWRKMEEKNAFKESYWGFSLNVILFQGET